MHCISESITTKSPSQAICRAAVQRRLWKVQVGGLGELDGSGFQSFILMLVHVNFKAHYTKYADKDIGLL